MHLDPALPILVALLCGILLLGLILKQLRQPHVVGYLFAGIIAGPHVLGLVTDEALLSRIGAIGVVMLLFFIGMEVSAKRLLASWRVAVVGTLFQIIFSIGLVWLMGKWLDWPLARIILIGFVISLSSTAVVLKILQDWKELDTETGQDVLGVLLVQDLAIIPMMIIIGLFGVEQHTDSWTIVKQVAGGIAMLIFFAWLISRETIHLPIPKWLRGDHEMQVFSALFICFGLALITGLLELSAALGAFAAGILVSTAKETQWVHHALEPFRVVFVALFFVSIGMLVNPTFLLEHWLQISLLVLAVYITNTFINASILRASGDDWRASLYGGALLSQIGEFSFVLAAIGLQSSLITQYGYQIVIEVIAVTLLLSPAWIMGIKLLTRTQKT